MHRSFVLPAILPAGKAKEGVPETQIAQGDAVVAQDSSVPDVMFLICWQMVQASGNLCRHGNDAYSRVGSSGPGQPQWMSAITRAKIPIARRGIIPICPAGIGLRLQRS